MDTCPVCHGIGAIRDGAPCPLCRSHTVLVAIDQPCIGCAGTGQASHGLCLRCRGKGVERRPIPFSEPLPDPIPVADLRGALREILDEELDGSHLQGVVTGLILLDAAQARRVGNPVGLQLARLLEQDGQVTITNEGVWHDPGDGNPPAPLYRFSTQA